MKTKSKKQIVRNWSEGIDALGGPNAVGKMLGRKHCTVSLWRFRGVPRGLRNRFVKLLLDADIEVSEPSVKPSPEVARAVDILSEGSAHGSI